MRIEAFDITGDVIANAAPVDGVQTGLPTNAVPYPTDQRPRLTITRIDGATPMGTPGSFAPPNLALPVDADVVVEIEANHVQLTSQVMVIVNRMGAPNDREVVAASALTGTFETSTTTASVNIPAGTRIGTIQAYVASTTFVP